MDKYKKLIHIIGPHENKREEILSCATDALRHASTLFKFEKGVDVVIFDSEEWDIHPKLHISGHARIYYIEIKVCHYKKDFNFDNFIKCELPSTIFHEFSHVVRANTVGYPETLLEELVDEGVSCYIEKTLGLNKNLPYINQIDNEERLIKEARKSFDFKLSTKLHNDWFYGTASIPEWAGYRLGYKIIENFVNKHNTPLDILVGMKAKDLI